MDRALIKSGYGFMGFLKRKGVKVSAEGFESRGTALEMSSTLLLQ